MDARSLKFIEQAKIYAQCDELADKEALAFLAGAKWADENPEWVNYNEKKPDTLPDSVYTENVLFCAENFMAERPYCAVFVGKYSPYSGRWVLTDGALLPMEMRVICWKSIKLPKEAQ